MREWKRPAWMKMFFEVATIVPPPQRIYIPAPEWDEAKESWGERAYETEAPSPFDEDGTGKMNGIPIERYPRA